MELVWIISYILFVAFLTFSFVYLFQHSTVFTYIYYNIRNRLFPCVNTINFITEDVAYITYYENRVEKHILISKSKSYHVGMKLNVVHNDITYELDPRFETVNTEDTKFKVNIITRRRNVKKEQ